MSSFEAYTVYGLLVFGIFHLIRDLLQEIKPKFWLANILTKSSSKTPWWYWKIFRSGIWISLSLIFGLLAAYFNQFYPYGFLSLICYLVFELAWVYYWFFF